MSSMYSTVSVLVIENEQRKSARTGNEYQHYAARCVLLDDHGKPVNVGTLRSRQMLPDLRDKLTVGTFRLGYAIVVPEGGDNKGDLMPMVTSVIPVPSGKAAPAAEQKG